MQTCFERCLFSILLIMTPVLLASCQDNNSTGNETLQKQEHVWKDQTDTLDKARAVEGILEESTQTQRRQIEAETE